MQRQHFGARLLSIRASEFEVQVQDSLTMLATFPKLLLDHALRRPDDQAMRVKEFGIWRTTTWRELAELVRHLSLGFASSGMARGDHVVIIGDNRPRLYAVMLATQALGAVPIP